MKKLVSCLLCMAMLLGFASCGSSDQKEKVVIYSSMESYRNDELSKQLREQFPDLNVVVQYQSTGNSAAKLQAEGSNTEADIVLELDTGYMEGLTDLLADLSDYDTSAYVDGINPDHNRYRIWSRPSGSIVVNTQVLQEKGLPEPQTYEDLLKPEYKGLIAMPNPKTSGTGYYFLKSWVNTMGEDGAFAYVDQLQENISQFTESGAGPVQLLSQGEIAIGLGMTFQATSELDKNVPLKIIVPPEGAPYNLNGFGIVKGKEDRESVRAVFDWLYNTYCLYDKEHFLPEQIYKEQENQLENYPELTYADMTGISDLEEKNRLLDRWNY